MPRSLLPAVIGFEWRYQTRRLTFAASAALLALVPFATVATGFGPPSLAVNSPYIIVETTALLTLVSVFVLPLLCIGAAVRDDEYRMRELIGATPVSPGALLGGRLVGVVLAGGLLQLLAMAALAALPFAVAVPDGRVAPFRLLPYAWSMLVFVLPNLLLCTALLYVIAAWSRSTLATFVASIGIYCGYFVTALMVDSPLMAGTRPPTPELLARVAVLDPFGLSAFFEQSRYWTPDERSSRLPALTGHLLLNRALVLAASGLLLVPLHWLDRRARHRSLTRAVARARQALRPESAQATDTPTMATPLSPRERVTPSPAAWWRTSGAALRLEVALLAQSWPLRALLVLWAAVMAIEAFGQLGGGEYGTRLLASSAVMADAVPTALWLVGTLSAHYFASEVVWRERSLRFDGIRDATPVASTSLLVGKLGALLLPVALTVVGFGTAMAVHVVAGGLPVEWRVYGAHVATSLVPLFVTTLLAVALQLLAGNRWLGLFVGLLLAYVAKDGATLGLEHPLLRFGAAPTLRWSDLDGFGAPLASFVAWQALWALGALVLVGLAAALWPRGAVSPWLERLRALPDAARRTLTPHGRMALGGAALLFVAAYGTMAHRTIVVTGWQSQADDVAWRAAYERAYRRLAGTPQPVIVHADLHIALEPELRRATFRTALVLENRTAQAIDTLWVMPSRDATDVTVSVADATPRRDARFGVVRLALAHPLAAGARDTLHVSFTLDRGGVRADDFAQDIAANGTFVRSMTFLPTLGYQPRHELPADEAELRAQHALGVATPTLLPAAASDSLMAIVRARGTEPSWLTVHTTVSTSEDQVAIAPGDLVREWRERGRRFFTYHLDTPGTPVLAVASGRYDVVRRVHDGLTVELYHHQPHGVQAERIVEIAASSVQRLQQHFGAYPHRTLRVVEIPASWGFGAFATTGALFLTESRGMLADAREGDVDLLLRRIGHEVAHQWWGHAVDPLPLEGSLVLVESLAKYGEQLLMEHDHGPDAVLDMLSYDADRYLAGRAESPTLEPTLATVRDEAWMYYGKGTLAFHALRASLGDSALLGALRTLLEREGGTHGAATVTQFVEALRAAAPDDEVRADVDEWFTDRILWDMAADSTAPASAVRTPRGVHIRAQFRVTRRRTDSTGEYAVSADGRRVDVAIVDGVLETPRTLARLRVPVTDGVARVDTVLRGVSPRDAVSLAVLIDPALRHIEQNRSDNRVEIGVPAGASAAGSRNRR